MQASDFVARFQSCRHNAKVRSRVLILPLGLLPLAFVACGGGTAASTPAKPAAAAKVRQTRTLTIRVTSVVKSTHSHRQSPNVRTPGDTVDFEDVLLNVSPQFGKSQNAKVGSDKGTMTFTSKNTARMDGVATLPDGTIVFKGQVTVLADKTISIPVTGGTGKYLHASGTLLVGSGTKQARNTYSLFFEGIPGPIA